ncbi:MAG: amidohydrolase family protein [Nocardioides sp.]
MPRPPAPSFSDRNGPDGLCQPADQAELDAEELIARWHGRGRASYAVTVRFAPTSTPEQLRIAGRLLERHPGVTLHSHLAENTIEGAWVGELFPGARSYLDVYVRHGLVGPRSLLAHGIWLDDTDRAEIADRGATLVHCPTSNLFLGSGLMPWRTCDRQRVPVVLGSDVGAGTTLAMQPVMADAYRVEALQGVRLPAWRALYAATRGAARALGLEHELGSLDVGCVADLAVWRWAGGPVAELRDRAATSLHERVFAWLMLADEHNLLETWVAGRPAYVGPRP